MECSICYEDINIDDSIILECCNNKVHIICLQKWLENNMNINSEIDKCFMCKNNNELIKNLLPSKNELSDDANYLSDASNNTIINISIDNTNDNINNIIVTRLNNRFIKYVFYNILILACIIYTFSYIIYNITEN